MKHARVALGFLLALAVPMTGQAQGTVDHLELLQPPQLVDCDTRPFFRVVLSPVDADRRPVGVSLGSGDPRPLFQVMDSGRSHRVVYVGGPESAHAAGSYTLILFDTSGSMNARMPGSGESRFTVAKAAFRRSLSTFEDGVDSIAVVPFDSRNVASRIKAASFQNTRKGVEDQLDALPNPLRDNNTALYSAVAAALPIMKAKADTGLPVSLVLFTDGENDVNRPGDDPGLLGPEGLKLVKDMAAEAKVPITTVGFGVTGIAAAQTSLREMAWPTPDNFYDVATSAERLTAIFESTRRKLTDRIVVLFGPVRDAREQLSGQSAQFNVKFRSGDSIVSSRAEPLWKSPGVGVPVAEATCSTAEASAILEGVDGEAPPPRPWRRIVILLSFAAGLAALWFGAPRLVWPDSYVPRPTLSALGVPPIEQPRVPGVEMPSAPSYSPSTPSYSPRPRPSAPAPAPPRAGGPATPAPQRAASPAAPDRTIVVPSKPSPRPQSPPPQRPRPAPPASRQDGDAGDATVFIPPPRKTPRVDD
ncbi:MAG: vWA domain-containing protein [Vicinamibacterales bacterium]